MRRRGLAVGAKLLVTMLFSRTQPLIRSEMSDRVARSTETCDCGLPCPLLATMEGRAEDILQLPAHSGGKVSVDPNVFHRVLEPSPARESQLRPSTASLGLTLTRR